MDCPNISWLSDEDYLRMLDRRVAEQRIPVSGSIDLTHRCNLRCVHCYIDKKQQADKFEEKELGTEAWLSIIDQIEQAGCLFLLFSGGEPLLRNDFPLIYRHAKEKGILVSVFTNATRVSESILSLFGELPPQLVEVSLYGATARTYENITGVSGSYDACMAGIRQLMDLGIKVKLKTMLMSLNRQEFDAIQALAEQLAVDFRFDAALFPRFSGDPYPVSLRVSPEEAIEKEMADPDRLHQWREFLKNMEGVVIPDNLYSCGAGETNFHIDPRGNLQSCLMTRSPSYNLVEGTFKEGWGAVIPDIKKKVAGTGFKCLKCSIRMVCDFCPAFFEMETGSEVVRSEYICAMGHLRHQRIIETDLS